MDLLDTVLRSANAEAYVELLANNKIDAATLPLLSNNDLEILGVNDSEARKNILKKASHLQIPHEKLNHVPFTDEDIELILSQITHQLYLHHASLSCALTRKDIVVCDIKLNTATKCLLNCISSFEKQLGEFESRINVKRNGPKGKKLFLY